MLRQSKLIFMIATVSIAAFAQSQVDAFQVFSNSRPGASANRPNSRTATGTISRGNRHGLAGGLSNHQWSYNSPGGQFRSNSYRRSTSTFGSPNQSPVFHNYHSGALNRAGTTTYHSGGSRIQRRSGVATFSGPGYYDPHVPGYNGVAVGGVIVNGGRTRLGGRYRSHHHGSGPIFFVDPYAGQTFSPYAPGYPWVPGGQVPFGVYAPPITVPYLNQGISIQPGASIAPGAAFPLNGVPESAPAPEMLPQPANANAEAYSAPIPIDESPLNNEFPVKGAPTDAVESSAVSRIRSLRYQTSGDAYYRQADFASAEALYRSSTTEAPDRIAPWLRLAFAQVSLQKHAEAVRSLKAALKRNDDPSAAWVSSEILAGNLATDQSLLAEDQLYDWLKQRPNSTDRLLLVAAWSEFRGSSSAARELLQMARHAGLSETLAVNLETVIADQHQKDDQPDRPKQAAPKAGNEKFDSKVPGNIESFSDADIKLLPQAGGESQSPSNPVEDNAPLQVPMEDGK